LKKLTNFTENIKMKKILYTLSFLSILLYACKDRDVINSPDPASTQATQDHLFAEQIFNDVERIVEEGFLSSGINKSCGSYQLMNANTANPDTLIINFGTTNCLYNAKLRKGKLIITYTGKYRDSLAVMTTIFDNYYVNNNLVQGEIIVTNQGRNNKGNMWFTIQVNNASIGTNNGTIDWDANRNREWVSGNATYFDISDDQYKITGTASGNATNGNAFTMEITDTLNMDLGCLPSCVIKSGKAKITPNGYTDRIISYGDLLCDCNFDVKINGNTYPIAVN